MWERFKDFLIRRLVEVSSEVDYGRYDNSEDVARWISMYEGSPSWCNKSTYIKDSELGSSIVSELARKVTIEMDSWVEGDERAEFINDGYERLVENSRYTIERMLVHGGLILKPFIDENDGRIGVDVVGADSFIPLTFNKFDELIEVIFLDVVKKGRYIYTRYETHRKVDGGYLVTNEVYLGLPSSPDNRKGRMIPLSTVDEWSHLEEEHFIPGIVKPLFVYMKAPFVNSKDMSSPLGASVLSKAEGLIEDHDRIYGEMMREYHETRVRIFMPEDMAMTIDGIDPEIENNDTYVLLRKPGQGGSDKIDSFSPTIRNNSYMEGMEAILRRIEFNCGLAYGDLSKKDDVVKTATEIIASRERSYNTIEDIQKRIEYAYRDLVAVMDTMYQKEFGSSNSSIVVKFNFDDSVVDEDNKLREASYEIK